MKKKYLLLPVVGLVITLSMQGQITTSARRSETCLLHNQILCVI